MLRTVYTPDSNRISVPIPERYVGTELEILVFPLTEVFVTGMDGNTASGADASFGGWADMDRAAEEVCSDIRAGRAFRNRDVAL